MSAYLELISAAEAPLKAEEAGPGELALANDNGEVADEEKAN